MNFFRYENRPQKMVLFTIFSTLLFTTIHPKAFALEARKIMINGSVSITNDGIFEDEICTANISKEATVTENQVSELIKFQKGCGGEVRTEIDLNVQLLEDGDVKVIGEARLYEGADENTNDLEDTESIDFLLPNNNKTKTIEVDLLNSGFGGGDKAKLNLNFANLSIAGDEDDE